MNFGSCSNEEPRVGLLMTVSCLVGPRRAEADSLLQIACWILLLDLFLMLLLPLSNYLPMDNLLELRDGEAVLASGLVHLCVALTRVNNNLLG